MSKSASAKPAEKPAEKTPPVDANADAATEATPDTETTPATATAPAARVIGTADAPSPATTHSALGKLGTEVLAEVRKGEDWIVRVLQDAKCAWKEHFRG